MNHQYSSTADISGSTLKKCLWENLGLQKQSIISIEIHLKGVRQKRALNNTSNRVHVRTTGYTPTSENYLLHKPGKSLTNSAHLTLFVYLCNPRGSHWCITYVDTEQRGPQAKCIVTFKNTSNRIIFFVTVDKSSFPVGAPVVPLWSWGLQGESLSPLSWKNMIETNLGNWETEGEGKKKRILRVKEQVPYLLSSQM